jgi:nucleoside-diphosphate-sugar epimerase
VWGSGLQGRDFVHIDDCIEAMLRTLAKVNDGSAVNIGSGRLVNFREVARLFVQLEGYQAEVKPVEDKPVGVHSRYADISHMKETLAWQPAIGIEEGFRRVLAVAHERKAKGL